MSDPRVFYSPREDATPVGELAAPAAVYAFVIQAYQQKKAAAPANERGKEGTPRSGGRAYVSKSTSGKGVNYVRDKIQLKSSHWPSREELLTKAAEGLVSRCLTVEASFHEEEEVLVIGHADSELRDSEVAMRLQVIDGTSQEKFLYLLAEIEEEARNHWERFLLFAVLDGRLTK